MEESGKITIVALGRLLGKVKAGTENTGKKCVRTQKRSSEGIERMQDSKEKRRKG